MTKCVDCEHRNKPSARFCAGCGAQLRFARDAQKYLLPGVILASRYEVEQMIGSGGFANAYLVKDTQMFQRQCVVKEVRIPQGASSHKLKDLQANFEREVRALMTLNHPGHPNIPEIYARFVTAEAYYLVMKYIEGQDLEKRLAQQGGQLPWREAARAALAVCDALSYMHNRKPPVLHRDIKPSNILRDQTGRFWLVDFGLSKVKAAITGALNETTAAGTVGYAPLEQWLMKAVPASDIYALGATLHHFVSGRDPQSLFSALNLENIEKHHGQFPLLRESDSTLPMALERLVDAAVREDAKLRPTAHQLKQGLEKLLTPNPGGQSFYFRNGQEARKPSDLVPLATQDWQEAREYLYKGPFENWFVALQQDDLVAQVKKAQQEASPDVGLDKFLRLLDPDFPAPTVTVEGYGKHFGRYDRSQKAPLPAKVLIENQGPSAFYGTFQLEAPWLTLSNDTFALAPQTNSELTLTVQPAQLDWGRQYTNKLTLHGNRAPVEIEFTLQTPSWWGSYDARVKLLGFQGEMVAALWAAGLGGILALIIWEVVPWGDLETERLEYHSLMIGWNFLMGATAGVTLLSYQEKRSWEWVEYIVMGVAYGGLHLFFVAAFFKGILEEIDMLDPKLLTLKFTQWPISDLPLTLWGAIVGLMWGLSFALIRFALKSIFRISKPSPSSSAPRGSALLQQMAKSARWLMPHFYLFNFLVATYAITARDLDLTPKQGGLLVSSLFVATLVISGGLYAVRKLLRL